MYSHTVVCFKEQLCLKGLHIKGLKIVDIARSVIVLRKSYLLLLQTVQARFWQGAASREIGGEDRSTSGASQYVPSRSNAYQATSGILYHFRLR